MVDIGTMIYSSGGHYEGEWKNHKRHYNGKMLYKNKDIYDGEWDEDRK